MNFLRPALILWILLYFLSEIGCGKKASQTPNQNAVRAAVAQEVKMPSETVQQPGSAAPRSSVSVVDRFLSLKTAAERDSFLEKGDFCRAELEYLRELNCITPVQRQIIERKTEMIDSEEEDHAEPPVKAAVEPDQARPVPPEPPAPEPPAELKVEEREIIVAPESLASRPGVSNILEAFNDPTLSVRARLTILFDSDLSNDNDSLEELSKLHGLPFRYWQTIRLLIVLNERGDIILEKVKQFMMLLEPGLQEELFLRSTVDSPRRFSRSDEFAACIFASSAFTSCRLDE
ncbi:MAG: hypothetical protein LBL16_04180 [Endomicrobium sp.]|jgi:hypothetical protein|nr:hypothetical protein [Endomicrobium sp.]